MNNQQDKEKGCIVQRLLFILSYHYYSSIPKDKFKKKCQVKCE